MKKINTLPDKLKSYSLLAGSIITSTVAAQGQIIYTDVVPDKELGGAVPSSFPETYEESIDLNNDGLFDFKLSVEIYGVDTAIGGYSFREKIDVINFSNGINTYTIEYVPFVLKKDCEDSIPQFDNFYGFIFGNFAYQFDGSVAYNWNNVVDRYIGLKVKLDTFHYGWLRLDVNTADTVPNIIIKEFAFEQTPLKKIEVCDTGSGSTSAANIAKAEYGLTIFPNPSSGKCVIRLEEPITGEAELSLKDATGREVLTENIQMTGIKRELPMDFSSLDRGMYFIQVKSKSATLSAKWIKE